MYDSRYDIESVRSVLGLGDDVTLYDFRSDSPDYVKMIRSRAGFLPDYSEERYERIKSGGQMNIAEKKRVKRAGIFADDMPQTIVTGVYNFSLDIIILCGDESEVMIDNLRRTLVPDFVPQIEIVAIKNYS